MASGETMGKMGVRAFHLNLLVDAFERGLRFKEEASHAYDVLCHLGQPLLALVLHNLWPVLELRVDLCERFCVILREESSLPELVGHVGALDGLAGEVEPALRRVVDPLSCVRLRLADPRERLVGAIRAVEAARWCLDARPQKRGHGPRDGGRQQHRHIHADVSTLP